MAKKKVAKKKVASKAPQMAFPTPQEDRQKPEHMVGESPTVCKRVRVVLLSGNTIIKDISNVCQYVERCLTVGVRQGKGNGYDVIPASGIERIEVRDL